MTSSTPTNARSESSRSTEAVPGVQPADARARRTALVLLAVMTLVGTGLALGLDATGPAIAEWLAGPTDAGGDTASGAFGRIAIVVAVLVVVVTIPLGVGALWMARIATRCRTSRRFPPPGFAVIRPTRIRTGPEAVTRARGLYALAALLAVAAIAIPTFTGMILAALLG